VEGNFQTTGAKRKKGPVTPITVQGGSGEKTRRRTDLFLMVSREGGLGSAPIEEPSKKGGNDEKAGFFRCLGEW